MERRTFLTLVAGAPIVSLLVACGSDDVAGPGASLPAVADTAVPVTAAADVESAIDLRLEFGYYGGFTTREISFQMQPSLLVTPDGRAITPGAVAAIYPGPLLPVDTIRTITPAGVAKVVAAARDAGMLADVAYDVNQNIADASTATLVIDAGDETFRHEAYALGAGGLPGEESDDSAERRAFAAFAEQLTDLVALVGAENLGPDEMFVPESYQLIAFPAGDVAGYDIDPTLVDWPSSTGIVLADVESCVEVSRDAVGTLFDDATQLTFFVEGDVTYSVIPRPVYAGRACP